MEENQQKVISTVFAKLDKEISALDLDSMIPQYYSFDKEEVYRAINDGDIRKLRQMSAYFYRFSGVYRQLIHKVVGIHYYRNYVTPLYYLSKSDKFNEKIDKEVMRYYRSSNIEQTCYNATLNAIMFGSCNLYETISSNGQIIQQLLPSERCRSRSEDEYGNKTIEFDFSYFDSMVSKYSVDEMKLIWKTLPKEFEKLYKNYKANKSNCADSRNPKWQLLDTQFARCYTSTLDGSPLFSNVFPDILNASDYKNIDIERAKQKLFKLIVQKFNLNDQGIPVAEDTEIVKSHRNLKNAVDGSSACVTTAFDVTSLSLDGGASTSSEQKYIDIAQDNMFDSFGTNSSVYGNSHGTIGANAVTANNNLISRSTQQLVHQYENWYKSKLNQVSKGKTIYGFSILPITIFNEKDLVPLYKAQLDLGGSVMLYYSALGIKNGDIEGLLMYENIRNMKELFVPLINSNQMSSDSGSNKKNDSDKSDETIRTEDVRE